MQKVVMISLGCPKNIVEAEYLLGIFKNKGLIIINDINEADIAVVHTCSFIKAAKAESERCIQNVLNIKKVTGLRVYVSGCLPQLLKEEMFELFPEIDGFVGTGTLNKLPELIFNKSSNEFYLSRLHFYPGGLNNSIYRLLSSNTSSTYLKIAEGCDHKCSFCIIPLLRGNYESRRIEVLVNEAKYLADNGIKELILIAQDVTSYGKDIYKVFALDKLLIKLSKIKELKWIRLLYAYPSSITDNLLDVFKEYDNICNYIDIPIQHISKNILASMKRPLNTVNIIEKIKNKLPNVILRTSIIIGFPGETEKDVSELVDFLNKMYFQYVGVFEYSDQKEATSSKFDKKIKRSVIKDRKLLIENIQYGIFKFKIAKISDNIIIILVENCFKNGRNYTVKGRAYFQAPEIDGNVIAISSCSVKIGSFYKVKVVGVKGYDIKAVLQDDLRN
ncbi:MAG: 30S ribosomal protein S12 methylthiotransferase RimO [Endomicrobium sp.]|jgi:ribosomal protein S12 methylthiotransferase|nr:30S ribosomal protein S12 methylthiotransferase RimO [Endomicrobium sp.]